MNDIDALTAKYSKINFRRLQKDYAKPILWKIMAVSVIADAILYCLMEFVSGGWQIILFYLFLFFGVGVIFFLLPAIVRIFLPLVINVIKAAFSIPEIIKMISIAVLVFTTEYLDSKLFEDD